MPALISVATLSMALGACSGEPLEFAPWSVEVPEAATVHGYAAVPDAEREGREIQLVADLVITGSGAADGPDFYFREYSSGVIAADDQGRIHVLDVGSQQVESFDADGNHLRKIGREGQGPGEFTGAAALTIAGSRLVIGDFTQRRLSLYSLDGEHLGDVALEFARRLNEMIGTSSGDLIASWQEVLEDRSRIRHISRVSIEAEELERLWSTPGQMNSSVTLENVEGARRGLVILHPSPLSKFSLGPDDEIYMTPADQYQLLGRALDVGVVRAARVAQALRPYPEESKEAIVGDIRERYPSITTSMFSWPDVLPVIEEIAVDGHGRVWVLPYLTEDELEEVDLRPVDVFSPELELIHSGLIEGLWQAARGDYVYRLVEDEETEEWQVVRSRLVTPF